MKLTLPTKTLKDALARVANIPGAHGASIHTQAVKLVADLAGLSLVRFTSEAKIVFTCDEGVEIANADDEPSVGHAGLVQIVNACHGEKITIKSDDKLLYMESGRGKWKMKVFDKDIMIDPPEPELETEHTNILLEDMAELLAFVAPASSKDASGKTPVFCGVSISGQSKGLLFTATDGKKCFMANAPYDLKVDCTIPNEGVSAILKSISGTKGAATLSIGETFATISSSNLEISVALLSDEYPKSVFKLIELSETSIKSKIQVNRDELAEALEACASVNETERIVNFNIIGKRLEITGSNSKEIEGGNTMECNATAPLYVGVPGSDMAAILKKMKTSGGVIEIMATPTAMFIKQPERIAFFALAKPRNLD